MDNICVDVFVTGINKSYDIVLSPQLNVAAAAEYIFKTVSEYEMLEISGANPILCSLNGKRVLRGELTLKDCDIKDGGRLILL